MHLQDLGISEWGQTVIIIQIYSQKRSATDYVESVVLGQRFEGRVCIGTGLYLIQYDCRFSRECVNIFREDESGDKLFRVFISFEKFFLFRLYLEIDVYVAFVLFRYKFFDGVCLTDLPATGYYQRTVSRFRFPFQQSLGNLAFHDFISSNAL